MTPTKVLLMLSVVWLQSVQGTQVCNLTDVECVTRGLNNVYKRLIPGIKDLTKPIDPLYAQKITGELETLKYETTNLTLTGLRNCEVVYVKCDEKNNTCVYHLHCPKLEVDYNFKVKGPLVSINTDGSGKALVTIDDYLLMFQMNYNKFISEKDQKLHMVITDYNIESALIGRFTFKSKSIIEGSHEKSILAEQHLNENYKTVEKLFRPRVIDKMLATFAKELNTYLLTFPLEDVIPRDSGV